MLVIFVAMFTCVMTSPLVPMPEEAKSNASTTKLQLVEGKSKSGSYDVTENEYCGGSSIQTWQDGTNAFYGQMVGIENCKLKCDSHTECTGFTLRESNGVCGNWKSGLLKPGRNTGYQCYAKPIVATEAPTEKPTEADSNMIPLTDAVQSSTLSTSGCSGNICTADKVIDGNTANEFSTMGVTQSGESEWWSARMTKVTTIDKILVYASEYPLGQGYYSRFKVETRMGNGSWTICKGEYSMTAPIDPHVVECDQPTIAEFVRVSVAGNKPLYLLEVQVIEKTQPGTTCSAGEIPTVEICPPATELTEEEKKIKDQCERELADSIAQKAIHDARVKAVEEFQESVDGDFCGDTEITEWLESIEDTWTPHEEKITEGCEIETEMITPLSDVITTLDCEGTTSDCIPTEEVTKIKDETKTLIEDNQKLVEECQTTVTNLETEKVPHTQEINALEEFELHVGDDWCGKPILEEFIEEKKGKWAPSQEKIDENCQTIIKESETLQEIEKIITNLVIDE